MLREDLAHADAARVPAHDMGKSMEHCLVAEVKYTTMCAQSFRAFYSDASNKGRFFDWPGGEAVCVCPGTGRRVETSTRERHLLVATQMCGFRVVGGTAHCLTRIIPRILTLEGYERLVGTAKGAPNRQTHLPPNAPRIAAGIPFAHRTRSGELMPPS